jgi:hypothetical protein
MSLCSFVEFVSGPSLAGGEVAGTKAEQAGDGRLVNLSGKPRGAGARRLLTGLPPAAAG